MNVTDRSNVLFNLNQELAKASWDKYCLQVLSHKDKHLRTRMIDILYDLQKSSKDGIFLPVFSNNLLIDLHFIESNSKGMLRVTPLGQDYLNLIMPTKVAPKVKITQRQYIQKKLNDNFISKHIFGICMLIVCAIIIGFFLLVTHPYDITRSLLVVLSASVPFPLIIIMMLIINRGFDMKKYRYQYQKLADNAWQKAKIEAINKQHSTKHDLIKFLCKDTKWNQYCTGIRPKLQYIIDNCMFEK